MSITEDSSKFILEALFSPRMFLNSLCDTMQVTLFSVHCAACTIYLLADRYHDQEQTWLWVTLEDFHHKSVWLRYVRSLYWAITTSTTTGYGDLHPMNSGEMVFDIFYMLYNLGLNSYLIGNMTNFVVQATMRTRKFVSKFSLCTLQFWLCSLDVVSRLQFSFFSRYSKFV